LWSSVTSDKGHFEELSRFADALADGQPGPIPVQELLQTTAVALHVEDLLFGRSAEEPD
jgi:hypothetical protein